MSGWKREWGACEHCRYFIWINEAPHPGPPHEPDASNTHFTTVLRCFQWNDGSQISWPDQNERVTGRFLLLVGAQGQGVPTTMGSSGKNCAEKISLAQPALLTLKSNTRIARFQCGYLLFLNTLLC
jgi:hypothetical protein